jgi:hypothetical protein
VLGRHAPRGSHGYGKIQLLNAQLIHGQPELLYIAQNKTAMIVSLAHLPGTE